MKNLYGIKSIIIYIHVFDFNSHYHGLSLKSFMRLTVYLKSISGTHYFKKGKLEKNGTYAVSLPFEVKKNEFSSSSI